MSASAAEEPSEEERRRSVPERTAEEPRHDEPGPLADRTPADGETVGNGWLLLGIFLLVTIGVLMLLIFASGGDADSSVML